MFIRAESVPYPQDIGMRDTIYVLTLNPMRGRTEGRHVIGYAHTEEEVYEMLKAAKADTAYTTTSPSSFSGHDHTWRHVFKEDSGLMWMNYEGEVHMMKLTSVYQAHGHKPLFE